MALFSLKKISEAAAGRQAYLRGISLYNSGKVTGFSRTHTPFYEEYVSADVAGDEPGVFHHAEAGLSADGRAEYLACDCPAAHAPEGACKHVVALLVHKYYADMVGGLSGGRGAGTPLKPRSDEAARRMMEGCLARQAAEMAAESAAESELVTLLPALELSGRQPRLGFTLGVRRQYVLKDIARFCADMAAGALTSPEAIEAMTHYTGLLTEHHVAPEGSVNNGAAEVRTLFNNKNVAMYVDGQPAVKNIQKDAPDIDVGVALWPGKSGTLNAGLGGYYIATPKNAANPDDAWTFIEYFLSKEVQEYFPISFPANLKARETDRFDDPISKVFAEQLTHTQNFQPLPDTPGAQQIILDAVQSVLTGMSTPEEAMQQANDSLNETLK